MAQLGARLDGIEEVRGSNPLGSTIFCSKGIEGAPTRWHTRPGVTGKIRGPNLLGSAILLDYAHDAKCHVIVLRCARDERIG